MTSSPLLILTFSFVFLFIVLNSTTARTLQMSSSKRKCIFYNWLSVKDHELAEISRITFDGSKITAASNQQAK